MMPGMVLRPATSFLLISQPSATTLATSATLATSTTLATSATLDTSATLATSASLATSATLACSTITPCTLLSTSSFPRERRAHQRGREGRWLGSSTPGSSL